MIGFWPIRVLLTSQFIISKNYFKGYDSLVYNQNRILQDLLIFSCDLFQINILLEDIFFPCLEEMKKIILNNASIKFNSY